jgi:hypothetical protein
MVFGNWICNTFVVGKAMIGGTNIIDVTINVVIVVYSVGE